MSTQHASQQHSFIQGHSQAETQFYSTLTIGTDHKTLTETDHKATDNKAEKLYDEKTTSTLKSCPFSARIKITDDLTLTSIPRVQLHFTISCQVDLPYMNVSEPILKDLVTLKFKNPRVFERPVKVPHKDVSVRYLASPIPTKDNYMILAEGSLTFRDPSADSMELLVEVQNKLLQKVGGTHEVYFFDDPYQVTVSEPMDPTEMMASVSGLTLDQPTVLLKGVPSQWFTEEPDSKPSKRLLKIFLDTFGKVRNLDVDEDEESTVHCKVLVQYEKCEDCENALKFLCAHSFQKDSDIADFEVSLTDFCQRANTWPIFPGGATKNVSVESTIHGITRGLMQQVEALKELSRKIEVKGDCKIVSVENRVGNSSSIEGISRGLMQQIEALKELSGKIEAKDDRKIVSVENTSSIEGISRGLMQVVEALEELSTQEEAKDDRMVT